MMPTVQITAPRVIYSYKKFLFSNLKTFDISKNLKRIKTGERATSGSWVKLVKWDAGFMPLVIPITALC